MILPIITVPNPLLREKSKPVTKLDKKIIQLINDLVETLVKKTDPAGVGLSAVQVGKLHRIFVTNLDDQIKVFINPEIIDRSKEMTFGDDPKRPLPEGCLSVPSLYGPIPRHLSITIKYFTFTSDAETSALQRARISKEPKATAEDLSTAKASFESLAEKTETFSHFPARVIQHEYDHLEGVLFTDYTLSTHQKIYFDDGKNLVPIPKPDKIVIW